MLASLLVLGDGCERAGLFDALAARMAVRARGDGSRLLASVFGAAVAVTAVLGLDATVVLLTPAAFAAAAKARLAARPHVYATSHLANSASLLLPVSNLTNLLAFSATGLSFAGFAAHMALPTAVAVVIEWIVIRRVFAGALEAPGRTPRTDVPPLPKRPLIILALDARRVRRRRAAERRRRLARGHRRAADRSRAPKAVDVPLLAFVLGLSLIVRALADAGLADIVANVLPSGSGLLALLGATFLAAALANALNNVPALLVLLPAAAAGRPAHRARGADRRQRRPEPHVHRIARHAAVATSAQRARRRGRASRVPPARRVVGAADPDPRYRRPVADDVRVLAWITEGGWEAVVDAVAKLRAGSVTLLHVDTVDVPGRGHRHEQVMQRMHALAGEAAQALLEDAEERLGTPSEKVAERGVAETIVYEHAHAHDVLVLARDGRHSGPHSIGHDQRWVIDHAPCAVLSPGARGRRTTRRRRPSRSRSPSRKRSHYEPSTRSAAPPSRADDRLAHAPRPVLAPVCATATATSSPSTSSSALRG